MPNIDIAFDTIVERNEYFKYWLDRLKDYMPNNLNTLADRKIVEIIATDKRNNLYRIAERFFNMWLIVTQGNPDQKRKARWMSEFLESWYDKHELQTKQYIGNYKGNDRAKIIIEIWAGVFNYVEERAIAACSEERESAWFIENLLILHQKSLVDKLFHNAEFGKRLQEKYTVLYYASQILNGKGNENNLRLRIPPELGSTLEDVLKKIKEEQERYSK